MLRFLLYPHLNFIRNSKLISFTDHSILSLSHTLTSTILSLFDKYLKHLMYETDGDLSIKQTSSFIDVNISIRTHPNRSPSSMMTRAIATAVPQSSDCRVSCPSHPPVPGNHPQSSPHHPRHRRRRHVTVAAVQ